MDTDKKPDEFTNDNSEQQKPDDFSVTDDTEQTQPTEEVSSEDANTEQPESTDVAEEPTLPQTAEPEITVAEPTPIDAEPLVPPKKHNKWLLIGIAVAVALALAITAFVVLRQAKPVQPVQKVETKKQLTSQGAELAYFDGSVEYQSAAKRQKVTRSVSLKQGDSVFTGDASRAIIALDDGSAVRLDQNSTVTLTTLTTTSVVITNKVGTVYSRVTPSKTRTFEISINGQTYTALGTAFKTINDPTTEGVAVYHSKVSVKGKPTVEEGQAYYRKTTDTSKLDVVSQLDTNALKSDTFLKWNKAEDEKEPAFADKLGTLKDIDVPMPAPAPAPAPVTKPVATAPSVGITASGVKVDGGIKVTWTPTGIDTKNGFKVAYSKSSTTPSYGTDSAKFVEGSARSVTLEIKDGKTWHVRVCRYDGDGKCSFYSNTVSVTAPYVEPAKVTSGSLSASLSGGTLNWTFTGSAPYGYKVVWNTSGTPTYPPTGTNSGAKLVSGNSLSLAEHISSPGTYKVRVCAYTNGTDPTACLYYSTEVTFVKS